MMNILFCVMQEIAPAATLDSKVNDVLGLDDDDLKRVLSHNIDEVMVMLPSDG